MPSVATLEAKPIRTKRFEGLVFCMSSSFSPSVQAAAASAARIAQLESALERKSAAAGSGDGEEMKKQVMEAETRAKMAEQRASEAAAAAAAAATAAAKQAKDREKALHDAAAKELDHLKGELVSSAIDVCCSACFAP